MSGAGYIVIGAVLGLIIGFWTFKIINTIKERNLFKKLTEGVSQQGADYLKFDTKYKEVKNEETNTKFDRETILRDLFSDGRPDRREQTIKSIKSEVNRREQTSEREHQFDGDDASVQRRNDIQISPNPESKQDTHRVVKLK